MNGFRRMQEVAARAGGGERRRDLLPHESRFADAGNDDVASTANNGSDGLGKFVIQPTGELIQGRGFGLDDLAGKLTGLKGERSGGKRGSKHGNVILDVEPAGKWVAAF